MSAMTPKLQIAFPGTGIVGAAGTDVTSRIRYQDGVTWSRGMDGTRVFASPVSGELGFVLDNQSKDYSAEYTSSPLYPNVVPGRKVFLTTASPARTLFTGHLKTILQQPGREQKSVAFGCLDTLERLGRKSVSTGVLENVTTGAAINAVLDAIGWPGNERVIDTGTMTLQQWWLDKEDAATAVVSLMLTEGPLARIYISPSGYFVFEDQDYRTTESRCTSSQATFSESTNVFFSYEPNFDDIISKCRLTQTERVLQSLAPIWSYGDDELTLTANQVLRLEVKGSDPFKNAVIPQPFGTNAIQTISSRVPLTSGDFDAGFKDVFATGLAYNISAATLKTALEGVTTIGSDNVICGGGPLNLAPITVEFRNDLKEAEQPLLVIKSRLNPATFNAALTVTETTPIDVGVNQVFTFHHDYVFTGGSFKIGFSSIKTPTILYSASAANVQTACENTTLFNSGDITGGGGPVNTDDFTLEIIDTQIGPGPPVGLPTIVSSTLVATKYVDALKVTETQKGGGPDFITVSGSIQFAFDRDNGGSITLSATAGASGWVGTGLQVRAQAFTVARTTDAAYPTTDVLDPQGQVYSPGIRQEVALAAVQALAQTYYDRFHVSIPSVIVSTATPMSDASACDAILAREVSDLITVVDAQTGVNHFCFIESMNYSIQNKVLSASFRCSLQGDAPVDFPSVAHVVRKWRGVLSQGGTSAPTAVELQNDLGNTIVWTRSAKGRYVGTLAGAFPEGRTLVFPAHVPNPTQPYVVAANRIDDNSIAVETGEQGAGYVEGGFLDSTSLEVLVYSAPLITVLPERQLFRGLINAPNSSDVLSTIELDNSYPSALVWNQSDGNGDYQGDIDGAFGDGTDLVFINSLIDATSNDQAVAITNGSLTLLSGTVNLGADTGVIADVIPDRGIDLMLMRATDSDENGTGENAGVLVYRASLRVSGTSAPTEWLTLENSLGVTPIFARTAAGRYTITAPGKFQLNKTFIKINGIRAVEDGSRASLWRLNNNTLALKSGTPDAGYLDGATIFGEGLSVEVLTYPSSPAFAPSDISGLKLWLEADGLPLADGDAVSLWPDSSGNANNATQSNASKKPILKTNIINGLPVVRFDGVNDFLQALSLSLSQPVTVFAVASINSSGDFGRVYDGVGTSNRILLGKQSSSTACLYAGAVLSYNETFPVSIGLYSSIYNSSSSAVYKNATLKASGNAGSQNPTSGLRIGCGQDGASEFLIGDIAEILVFNSALSTPNRQAVEAYLNAKYAIY